MDTTKWFDRKFAFDFGPEEYPFIHKRLQQAPDALRELLTGLPENILILKPQGAWSIKEHAGHLSILEKIWYVRFLDIQACKPTLTPADLDNKATSDAGFNAWTVPALLELFSAERQATLTLLAGMDALDQSRTSLHPRMQQPMRLIDHAYFAAEHDAHHLARIRELAG